jgi:hypothetical protein
MNLVYTQIPAVRLHCTLGEGHSVSRVQARPKIAIRTDTIQPVLVATRSKTWVCGCSPAKIVGSYPAGDMGVFCFECYVFSGRGLCDELITRPEESYRLRCVVVVCDLEFSLMRRPWAIGVVVPITNDKIQCM